jgi:hypothetical protein
MNVIGFLCVSLGSSTVHLHDSIGSRRACTCSEAGISSQNGDRAWGVYYRCVVRFLWAKGLKSKDIHKEMFTVYGGKCLSVKRLTTESRNVAKVSLMKSLKRRGGSGWESSQKNFCAAGKAMGQVYQCWWTICRDISVFSRFVYHMFYNLYPFVNHFGGIEIAYSV